MTPAPPTSPGQDAPPDPPPFLGSWRNVYLLVLVSQALLVGLLALFGAFAS
ncbi:MAG: hypothetical protein IT385_11310 [Deltaproteobacteria bacterium]|nr:hypothetical protein [Deltaproteobacteria bacterium]